jgi:hypothetical protein
MIYLFLITWLSPLPVLSSYTIRQDLEPTFEIIRIWHLIRLFKSPRFGSGIMFLNKIANGCNWGLKRSRSCPRTVFQKVSAPDELIVDDLGFHNEKPESFGISSLHKLYRNSCLGGYSDFGTLIYFTLIWIEEKPKIKLQNMFCFIFIHFLQSSSL